MSTIRDKQNDKQRLQNLLQTALKDARGTEHKFYTPSPGQILSHVDHRVARALIDVVWEEIERRTKDEQYGEKETT